MAKRNATTATEIPAKRFEIRTPNPTFSGERNGLKFRAGVALTTDAGLAAALADQGYQVKDLDAPKTAAKEGEQA